MLKNIAKTISRIIPDKLYVEFFYFKEFRRRINLNNPSTFNEHINKIKLNNRSELLTICADKYLVRNYVSKLIGSDVLIPLLWSGKDPKEIPFERLPSSFVIKCNHGSATNIIVKDKKSLNKQQTIIQLKKWLKYNYYYSRREWCYKNIDRRIVIEKFIGDHNQVPSDYKFYVVNGKIEIVHVDIERFNNHKKYDLDVNLKSFTQDDFELEKPKNYYLMKSYAEKLSRGFEFVRVDFYNVSGKIYFGEMTFYPSGGYKKFSPPELDHFLGEKF